MKANMKNINVKIKEDSFSYPIIIDHNLTIKIPQLIKNKYQGNKIFVVTDNNVNDIYGEKIKKILKENGFKVTFYVLPAGEKAKSFKYLKKGYDLLVENNFHRDHLIMALGGGVVGDLAGFLAATFMRGIDLIQVPTTLLAQVDSSVGGKTAINHQQGKNLIGSFYQPEMVIINIDFLKTLPLRELKTGLAEVIKHGIIADREYFDFLLENKDLVYNLKPDIMARVISRSCEIKGEIVSRDQKEKGERVLLNYGHNIAHALEAITDYGHFTHGEAVAIGIRGETRLSWKNNFIEKEQLEIVENILDLYDLKSSLPANINTENLYQAMWHDKKVKKSTINWVLLKDIGRAFAAGGISKNKILEVLEGLKK